MKVVLVGAGSIGRRHLANLRALGAVECELVEVDAARARTVSDELGVPVRGSLGEALAARPDVALIATPTHQHLEQALACARAGVHFFVEKPLAADEGAVAELVGEAERRGLVGMVGCNLRFDDVYQAVKRALDGRALGRVFSAHLHFGHDLAAWRPGVDYRTLYSAHRAQGGGIVLDAIHEIDLALWWFGALRRVVALPRRTGALDGDVEDVVDALLEFRTGVTVGIHLNYRDPVYRRSISVAGSEAVVEGDFAARTVRLRKPGAADEVTTFADDRNAMYVRELAHFLRVVRGEEEPLAPLADGVRALGAALAMRDRGPVVEIERPRFPFARVPVVIQARLGSTRLPGKVLKPAAGKTMLELLVERLRRARLVDRIVLATSEAPADRALVELAERIGLTWFAGSEHDVLARYIGAVRRYDLPAVVRITGDCPLMDPAVVDQAIARFLEARPDYCTNFVARSVPDGLDVEVMTRDAIERAHREAREPYDREHVTPYLYRHPERFEVIDVAPFDRHLAAYRWTLDTPADYEFIKTIFERLYPENPAFGMNDVISLLARQPELETVPRYQL